MGLKLRVTWYYDPDEWGKVTKVEVESMSDWAKTLLAYVARETIAHVSFESAEHQDSTIRTVVAVLERRLLGLLEAGEVNFSKHDECEDGFYSCPKAEGYFGTDDQNHCSCGKDAWDAAKAKASRP